MDRFEVTPEVRVLLAYWRGNASAVHRQLVARAKTAVGELATAVPAGAPMEPVPVLDPVPSLSTFLRAVRRDLTSGERAGLARGPEAARAHDVFGRRATQWRNHTWEADHVQAPLVVDADGELVRPWVTWFIDVATKTITGTAVTPGHPSRASSSTRAPRRPWRACWASHSAPSRGYVKDQIRRPKQALADWMAGEVRRRWQPLVRKGARAQAAARTGLTIETRARFGFTAAPGTTDDGRMRRITQHLPPDLAGRLFAAQDAGASEATLQQIAAQGLQDGYFRAGGRRADGLLVEFTDIDYLDVDY